VGLVVPSALAVAAFFFALSEVCAGGVGFVVLASDEDVCAAKATAGIPRPPLNDKVAKASAVYNGLRVDTYGM
jgi:hypothetical protein